VRCRRTYVLNNTFLRLDKIHQKIITDEAYRSFNASAAAFLESNAGLDSAGPASKLVTKFFLALWCALIGALFTFPGLRTAR
jgi:hypothetical protein